MKLNKGCFSEIQYINIIDVYTNYENDKNNFIFYDEKFLIGKSNLESDDFDVLYFARRDLEEAVIPSFIKVINSNAFEDCKTLKTVIFSEDSNLERIENNAFSKTLIQNISIPDKVVKIGEFCFSGCNKLINVEFSANSNLHSIGKSAFSFQTNSAFNFSHNQFSSKRRKEFNQSLSISSSRDIETVFIPSNIK